MLAVVMGYWHRIVILGLSVWIVAPLLHRPPGWVNYLEGFGIGVVAVVTGMAWENDTKDPRREAVASFVTAGAMIGFLIWRKL